MINYNPSEMRKINDIFFNLYFDGNKNVIKGEIHFSARYQLSDRKKNREWFIVHCTSGKDCVQDVYEIEINLSTNPPQVLETASRIHQFAEEHGITKNDLHLHSNGNCCLGLFTFRESETLSEFVFNKVYPYFVWQAYYEKFKKIPPCGEYSHGKAGVQEFKEHRKLLGRNQLCTCGSGKKFKYCCISSNRRTTFDSLTVNEGIKLKTNQNHSPI